MAKMISSPMLSSRRSLSTSALRSAPSTIVRDFGIDPATLDLKKPVYPREMREELTELAIAHYGPQKGPAAVRRALDLGLSVKEVIEIG